ncbi:peptidylprolyl isomerase [Sphingorhabdus sp. IMCC26285]|uniref:Peptidylprolyl isomerase n=1 Tax=Sphingorhabdus profundilacus TaxID=2509718 RepID=A0A6I4M7R9_9SPHN|nr:peptidylprolyl isomerase [Sphingorhabdus profundilacus]MVZ98788.1 peptidylprolyl isomerase [Sphingorhabdus profundilacus]
MKKFLNLTAAVAFCASTPVFAQEAKTYPAPSEIVAAAKAQEWAPIAPSDLLVMDLAPDAAGKPRHVVIQLLPAPFSQGWIGNIRKLATAHWWDGTSINRVQDNYVVQWGDATEKKILPEGLEVVPESGYTVPLVDPFASMLLFSAIVGQKEAEDACKRESENKISACFREVDRQIIRRDPYADGYGFYKGWPAGVDPKTAWPLHCYGMVGVGRNLSPDTGTGAELYTVIGHAPRHLDRNIALVGRVIEGIEHLSSLPRGTGALGFYEKGEERVPILSVRLGTDVQNVPSFEYLYTHTPSFKAYSDARANRRDPFFITPAGGADICNIPVPVRRKPSK